MNLEAFKLRTNMFADQFAERSPYLGCHTTLFSTCTEALRDSDPGNGCEGGLQVAAKWF